MSASAVRCRTGAETKERCISALAFDWDADGDHDLLLGSYENGHLYRQMNEGSDAAPKYTGRNIAVHAGDALFELPAKMTTPRLVDWDGDGDQDLIAGSFGGRDGEGGGVYLAVNEGAVGAPRFGALEVLIAPSAFGWKASTRPDRGLYAEPVDVDGDGDLDLIVGGYSHWTPESRELSAEEQARVAELEARMETLQAQQQKVIARMQEAVTQATEGLEPGSDELRAKQREVREKFSEELRAPSKEMQGMRTELGTLTPGPKTEAAIWIYERVGAA